jgi:hypothetical protein
MGAIGFSEKPLSIEDIKQAINKLMGYTRI